MVKIRLARAGANKRPFFHIVVTDSRTKRDGRLIERVGYFNPIAKAHEKALHVDMERVAFWRARGAQTSDRVAQLLKRLAAETAKTAEAA